MEKILIVGGSGLLGKSLQKKLIEKGFEVMTLGRLGSIKSNVFTWDLTKKTIQKEAVTSADYIINLAGAGIGERRWTVSRKKTLIDSRVESTKFLIQTIIQTKSTPKAYIAASAVGYYGGITTNKTYTESDLPSKDFLGECTSKWEESSTKIEEINVRRVIFRIGVVLSRSGGALFKLLPPFKLGLGAAIGTGKQYFPWIHIDDLCNGFIYAIENSKINGTYNLVSPSIDTNKELSKILSNVLKKPYWLPNIPSFILKLILGKMATLVVDGSKISCKKFLKTGFNFDYTDLNKALSNLLNEPNK